jgi:hypothetical protein
MKGAAAAVNEVLDRHDAIILDFDGLAQWLALQAGQSG